ncbi:GntR family transcriptional regulator [Pseudonocardia zijingensis]|uniref:GntR family transcriptional regulator n=1 Tax=Pseudonocardia zijingensis TaxID=153376 RepID=A0ABN1N7H0_9PSEU
MDDSLRVKATPSLRERVVESLRDAIADGRLAPGERLVERELVERLGVSRPSVREALSQLENEGLVTIIPNKGPLVTVVGIEDAEDIYQVRTMLEGLAARLFVRRATDAQLRELKRTVKELEKIYAKFEARPFLEAKNEFYRVLLEGAGNKQVTAMLRTVHTKASQLRATSLSNPERAQASIQEIRDLVKALEARDEDAAWVACTTHIENAAVAALAVLREQNSEAAP